MNYVPPEVYVSNNVYIPYRYLPIHFNQLN